MSSESQSVGNGYGTLYFISPSQFFVTFTGVALFAILSDRSLGHFEEWVQAAGYQALFQRMYRDIMIMGLASFAINIIISASNGSLGSWELAYMFGDNIIFLISLSFCLQGVGVMFLSVADAMAWDRASKISSAELLVDVERETRVNSFSWRNRMFPFSITRSQLEFRVFNGLFSRLYKIGGNYSDFNFGFYLRFCHQQFVIELIEMTPQKWLFLVFLIGSASIFYEINPFRCNSNRCESLYSITLYLSFGGFLVLFAFLTLFYARRSEIEILRRSGLSSISDYEIYLLQEDKIKEVVDKHVISKDDVRRAIGRITLERDIESKSNDFKNKLAKRKKWHAIYRKYFCFFDAQIDLEEQSISKIFADQSASNYSSLSNDAIINSGSYDHYSSGKVLDQKSSDQLVSSEGSLKNGRRRPIRNNRWRRVRENVRQLKNIPVSNLDDVVPISPISTPRLVDRKDYITSDFSERSGIDSFESELSSDNNEAVGHKLQQQPSSLSLKRRSSIFDIVMSTNIIYSSSHNGSGEIVNTDQKQDGDSESRTRTESADDLIRIQNKRKLDVKLFFEKETDDSSAPKYQSLFTFGRPEIFFGFIHILILCCAFFTSWFIVAIAFMYSDLTKTESFIFFASALCILIVTFGLISEIIRISVILKSLMKLNTKALHQAYDKSEKITKAITALHENLKRRFSILTGGSEKIHHNHIIDFFEDINIQKNWEISSEEFDIMFGRLGIFVDKNTSLEVFRRIDINNEGGISIEEFNKFILPEESAAAEEKKAKFFNSRNLKEIAAKGKMGTAALILKIITDNEANFQ